MNIGLDSIKTLPHLLDRVFISKGLNDTFFHDHGDPDNRGIYTNVLNNIDLMDEILTEL